MSEYTVNADFTINVSVRVEADSEDEAKNLALTEIMNKNCDFLDPIEDPKINHAELEHEDETQICSHCIQDGFDCDIL